MELKKGKKIYFASDNHLGAPSREKSLEREKIFVKWLDEIKKDACEIFLLGDLFDFWIEYNEVVPKGFVRVLGKLAEISDSGIQINFFVGIEFIQAFTQDVRMYDYNSQTSYEDNRVDLLSGLKFGWTIPLHKKSDNQYYYY